MLQQLLHFLIKMVNWLFKSQYANTYDFFPHVICTRGKKKCLHLDLCFFWDHSISYSVPSYLHDGQGKKSKSAEKSEGIL